MIVYINNAQALQGVDERTGQPLITWYTGGDDFSTMMLTREAQLNAITANVQARADWENKVITVKMNGGRPAPAPYQNWGEYLGKMPQLLIVRDGYYDWEAGKIQPGTPMFGSFNPPLTPA